MQIHAIVGTFTCRMSHKSLLNWS